MSNLVKYGRKSERMERFDTEAEGSESNSGILRRKRAAARNEKVRQSNVHYREADAMETRERRRRIQDVIGETAEEHMRYRRGDEYVPSYGEAVVDRVKRKFGGRQ